MKTLKSLTIIALAAMSLASCQKNSPVEIVPDGYKKVNFALGTRASGAATETTVNKVQISVFDNNGKYVAGKSGDGSQISLNVPVGVSNFYVCALANGADDNIYKIPNLDTLKKRRSVLGASGNLFEMFVIRDKVALQQEQTCSLEVKRFASKVEIDAVKDSIQYNHSLTINKIYLVNVNSNVNFDFTTETKDMVYKQLGEYKSGESTITPFTYEEISSGNTLTSGQTYSTAHAFYCYPNPVKTETDDLKFTRLVVEAMLDGSKYYYPVNIVGGDKGIESNKVYKVTQMTIAGPGSSSPDVPVNKQNLTFKVVVADWENGTSQSVTI